MLDQSYDCMYMVFGHLIEIVVLEMSKQQCFVALSQHGVHETHLIRDMEDMVIQANAVGRMHSQVTHKLTIPKQQLDSKT